MFGRMRTPAEGTARLVSYNEANMRNEFDVYLYVRLVVKANGLERTAVDTYPGIPALAAADGSRLCLDPGSPEAQPAIARAMQAVGGLTAQPPAGASAGRRR
jgi:hypothetical protein